MWFLWLYPKFVGSRRKESDSSVQQFEADFNNSPGHTSPVLPKKTNTERMRDEEILGIQIDGATIDGKIKTNSKLFNGNAINLF